MKTVFVYGLFMATVLWTLNLHVALKIRCNETATMPRPELIHGLHESFWILPTMKKTRELFLDTQVENNNIIKLTKRRKDLKCRKGKRDRNSPLTKYCSCSWHYVLNADDNRIPKHMMEVRCNCKKRCWTGNARSRCEPIIYFYPVYRKNSTDKDGFCTFTDSLEPITVGCTCVNKKRRKIVSP